MRVPMAACTAYVAPALALVQNLTPPRSRAPAAAVLMLMFNIIGLGLGPLFAGKVSDGLTPDYGNDTLTRPTNTGSTSGTASSWQSLYATRHPRNSHTNFSTTKAITNNQ